eukprot:8153443-Prorocentrum_lima.AAC.1
MPNSMRQTLQRLLSDKVLQLWHASGLRVRSHNLATQTSTPFAGCSALATWVLQSSLAMCLPM